MTHPQPTLLLTRPLPQSQRFAGMCRERLGDIPVLLSPVLRIEPRTQTFDLSRFCGVVLTSENGARALAALADVKNIQAWCVGDRTAKIATDLGMTARSAGGNADDLVALVQAERPRGTVMHAHGVHTRGDIAKRLTDAGVAVDARVVYDQIETDLSAAALSLLSDCLPVVLPLFSPRSASLLSAALHCATAPLAVVALSSSVASAWTGPEPVFFSVAEQPDATNMIKKIAVIWADLST